MSVESWERRQAREHEKELERLRHGGAWAEAVLWIGVAWAIAAVLIVCALTGVKLS